MCGDYFRVVFCAFRNIDTTPRVRGLPGPRINKAGQRRYNPACAGTTQACLLARYRRSIQPHVCGDYAGTPSGSGPLSDTTPRVRGLPGSTSCTGRITQYNPACAGTTRRSRSRQISSSIQPRVCGDYGMITAWPTLAADTTPRVRGLRTRSFFEVNAAEIQPRVCGDYCARNLSLASGTDTTPRVRGLRHQQVLAVLG